MVCLYCQAPSGAPPLSSKQAVGSKDSSPGKCKRTKFKVFHGIAQFCAMDGISGGIMYAVIRAGGKQYRVAPGDVVKVEKTGSNGDVDFEVLAVSGDDGKIGLQKDAQVTGEVLGEGRADKILVFHFKRKK